MSDPCDRWPYPSCGGDGPRTPAEIAVFLFGFVCLFLGGWLASKPKKSAIERAVQNFIFFYLMGGSLVLFAIIRMVVWLSQR